mgnify:CR=1 FL=1
MKKAAVFLMILTLSVSSAACGNKEKDDNQADAKTEQSQNADNSKDNDKSDTQTKEADNKMYELSSEDDVWTIKVSAPKGCSETDFSSDTAGAFERIGNVDGSSLQYVMTLRNTDVSTVESDMKEEVQYLYTANSDDTIPAMDIRTKDADIGHEAQIGKISDDAVFYLMSRGISEEDARAMIVSGFADNVSKELPLEYAVEMNNLIRLEMKGSIG